MRLSDFDKDTVLEMLGLATRPSAADAVTLLEALEAEAAGIADAVRLPKMSRASSTTSGSESSSAPPSPSAQRPRPYQCFTSW